MGQNTRHSTLHESGGMETSGECANLCHGCVIDAC